MLSMLLYACDKTSKEQDNQTTLELASPDKSIKLGSNEAQVVARIKQTSGLSEAKNITKIEYPKTAKGYYAIVTYEKANGELANMVFANFQLGLVTSELTFHDGLSNQPSTQNDEEDGDGATCYTYWCTDYDTCTSCQVTVTDPFGTPTLKCTCTQCRLHQKKEPCP